MQALIITDRKAYNCQTEQQLRVAIEEIIKNHRKLNEDQKQLVLEFFNNCPKIDQTVLHVASACGLFGVMVIDN